MPAPRPGYQRQDTDTGIARKSLDIGGSSSPTSKSKFDEAEQIGGDKNDTFVTNNALPLYDGEEDKIHDEGVTTAEDLVTQVIHVEDDPTLNPWTFRMFFLGKNGVSLKRESENQLTNAKASDCPSSAPPSRKSSISSLKQSTSPSSS